MLHIIKSTILLVIALGLFALTLILAQDLVNQVAEIAQFNELTRPAIYTALIVAYFDILVLLTEALPISRR